MSDLFNLERFVAAQNHVWPDVLRELKNGRKTSHWMWFVFPQIMGLGTSPTSVTYAISSLEEARAYLAHPVLGPRLSECARILLEHNGASAEQIFGYPDVLKLRSSLTLFSRASSQDYIYSALLAKFYGAEPDPQTVSLIVPD